MFVLPGANSALSHYSSNLLFWAKQMDGQEHVRVFNTAGMSVLPPVLLAGLGHSQVCCQRRLAD